MTDPVPGPTDPRVATPFFQMPSRKVIAAALSDALMTVITLVAQKHGLSLDPQIDGAIAVLVAALVGFAVAYVVPERSTL
ncbi:MAG TPA: hypothetical protein VGM15_03170 [Burkholderiaceae bacterium]|jgi:hypothetical protein